MSWRWWPWRRINGRTRAVEREREDALIEREAARRRLEATRRWARATDRRIDVLAHWIDDALAGR